MKRLILLAIALLASAVRAQDYRAMMVDTNGVQRAPAMLTLTNVVIQGFGLADLGDVDLADRSIGDVLSWDGTNHVFVAQGGHAPVTLGAGSLGSLDGQQYTLSTNSVINALAGASIAPEALNNSGGNLSIDAEQILITADGGDGVLSIQGKLSLDSELTTNAPITSSADPAPVISGFRISASQLTGDLPPLNAGLVTNINASAISSGVLNVSRLGSGAPGTNTWLRGDGTWEELMIPDSFDPETAPHGGTTANNLAETTTVKQLADRFDAFVGGGAGSDTFSSGAWTGPKQGASAEAVGWAIKSYATTNAFFLAAGFTRNSATPSTGTMDSVFETPAGSTAFATTGAIRFRLIGDATSGITYRVYVFKAGSTSAVYDSTALTLGSTSVPTVISLDAGSLGAFSAGTLYTVRLELSVTTNGIYIIGQPSITVIK